MASDDASPGGSKPSSRSSSPSEVLPEALAFGREKRATAGNKLRALLDAEFQEEEIFKEDEDDQEFERQKSDEEEVYLSESSESDSDEDAGDEEAGEKQLLAQQKAEATQARKRKVDKSFVKPPVAKRRIPTEPKTTSTAGILASKPTSTTSSVSNRRISFDPTLLVSRRSSRALTVQTTNETQSRIISAAARRATLPIIPRREQTPPLTQEERLAQAVLTEEENKKSLKRIVEAEEERAKKRREKLEALRRRRFDEPVVRFISRRRSLIEEIPAASDDDDEKEEEDVVIVDGKQESVGTPKVKTEEIIPMVVDEKDAENSTNGPNGEEKNAESDKMNIDQQPEENPAKDSIVESAPENTDVKASPPQIQRESEPAEDIISPTSVHSSSEAERMNVDDDIVATKDAIMEKTSQDVVNAPSPHTPASATNERKSAEGENEDDGVEQSLITKGDSKLTETNTSAEHPQPVATTIEPAAEPVISPSKPASPFESLQLKTPPPYHEAYFTSNTVSILPLPSQPLQSTRDTFFPSIPLLPPPKPKPSARCPITGLPARYKDPLSGVGYYDIHAFKILREVGRKGGRYVWCSEGGWFVGELGWGGRGAKGVPEGWTA